MQSFCMAQIQMADTITALRIPQKARWNGMIPGRWVSGAFDPEAAPVIRQEGPGTYRVTLGKGPDAEFIVVDTLQKRIVKDSNPGNAPNRPFKTEEN